MNRPRSTKRLLTDMLKDGHLTRQALADVLGIAAHRLNRLQMGSVQATDLEHTNILSYYETTFLDPPDAGDLHDIDATPSPTEGHYICQPRSPDHSPEDAPSQPSKTAEPRTSNGW